eukprot:6185641-Pleurochrysis_carterae.AAC.3
MPLVQVVFLSEVAVPNKDNIKYPVRELERYPQLPCKHKSIIATNKPRGLRRYSSATVVPSLSPLMLHSVRKQTTPLVEASPIRKSRGALMNSKVTFTMKRSKVAPMA